MATKKIIVELLFISTLLVMVAFNSCKREQTFRVKSSDCTLCKKCLSACGYHAISYIEGSGSTPDKVVIDPKKCVGCGECVKACSYYAIYSQHD